MSTPSKEALKAAKTLFTGAFFPECEVASIIDRHFAPLRKRLAEMESLLASEKTTRNSIIAKGQQAEARVKELESTCAELVTDGNAITLAANLARQSERVKELESDLKTVAKAEFYLRHTNSELVGALRDARHLVAEWESADGEPATELLKRIDAAIARHAAGEPAIDSLLAVTPVYTTEMRGRLQKAADAVDAGEPEAQT